MATTDVHQTETSARPPVYLLPVVLFAVLFGVAVLLAQVAPSRVTSGVYQVVVGDHAAVIPTEALTCTRAGDTATCTTEVDARRLTIEVHYAGVPEPGPCSARHGDRPVSCVPTMGNYGHTSQTVWIREDLGLSRAQLADLDEAAPWWRATDELTSAMMLLIGTLAAAAGVSTFLLHRRFRPMWPDRRRWLALGTGVVALALFPATGLLFVSPLPGASVLLIALSPLSLLASAMMAGWQWQLGGPQVGRVGSAIIAAAVVTFYTGVATLVFLVQSGFDD